MSCCLMSHSLPPSFSPHLDPGRTMFGPPPSVSQSNIESVVQSHMEAGDILTSQSSFPYGPFYKVRPDSVLFVSHLLNCMHFDFVC